MGQWTTFKSVLVGSQSFQSFGRMPWTPCPCWSSSWRRSAIMADIESPLLTSVSQCQLPKAVCFIKEQEQMEQEKCERSEAYCPKSGMWKWASFEIVVVDNFAITLKWLVMCPGQLVLSMVFQLGKVSSHGHHWVLDISSLSQNILLNQHIWQCQTARELYLELKDLSHVGES